MARALHRGWMVVAALAIAAAAILGYTQTRSPVVPEPTAAAQAQETPSVVRVPAELPAVETHADAGSSQPSADSVARWVADATGDDANARAAAIIALATAPRSQAVPVLNRLLDSGEVKDRYLALNSLRTLALEQGDADGAIRDALRHAIYHGEDESVVSSVQGALDDIEYQLGRPKSP